jgi:hypothetical protein
MDAIKQTITLALATIAIPTAVAGLRLLPHRDTAPVEWAMFWLLSLLGMLAAIASLFCGMLYLWRAPRWARDATEAANAEGEALLDVTYPTAAIAMVVAATLFMVAAFIAFFVSA